jgi:hypothetical protein
LTRASIETKAAGESPSFFIQKQVADALHLVKQPRQVAVVPAHAS